MIEFLTTHGTLASLQRIIDQARERIVLVSPYLQLSLDVRQRLASASERGVAILLVYGKQKKLKRDQTTALESIRRLELRFYKDLHAKCYFSDVGLILTSMNLYQASQNNREMGVFVTPDEGLYAQAKREAEQIAHHADVAEAAPKKKSSYKPIPRTSSQVAETKGSETRWFDSDSTAKPHGHCVRCRSWIGLDPFRPLCGDCFGTWSKFRDKGFPERWCHDCGQEAPTSFGKPFCRACFPKHRRAFGEAAKSPFG